ncbi:MAG: hypothetical protein AAF411_27005 [Myxococcota bacterium]
MKTVDGESLLGLADVEALRAFVWTSRSHQDPNATYRGDEL